MVTTDFLIFVVIAKVDATTAGMMTAETMTARMISEVDATLGAIETEVSDVKISDVMTDATSGEMTDAKTDAVVVKISDVTTDAISGVKISDVMTDAHNDLDVKSVKIVLVVAITQIQESLGATMIETTIETTIVAIVDAMKGVQIATLRAMIDVMIDAVVVKISVEMIVGITNETMADVIHAINRVVIHDAMTIGTEVALVDLVNLRLQLLAAIEPHVVHIFNFQQPHLQAVGAKENLELKTSELEDNYLENKKDSGQSRVFFILA